MISFHQQHNSDATLGAVVIPLEEGHRFGILEAGADGQVISFEEKPDFGHNIIPSMMAQGRRVYAYPFTGYWQDVGTIQSYWEAHMALLDDQPAFDLYDPS